MAADAAAVEAKAVVDEQKKPEAQAAEGQQAPACDAAKGASLGDQIKKALLVGVGAVRLVEEEVREFKVKEFVERAIQAGEATERDLVDLLERGKKKTRETATAAEADIDSTIEKALRKVSVPTKAQLDTLVARIDDLGRKLEQLASSARKAK